MACRKMMLLLLGIVAVVCAAPRVTHSPFGSSGFSSLNNHGSNNSSSEEDSTDSSADTVTSSAGASANDSSSSNGGISLHDLIYGRPFITDDAKPSSSSSLSFGSSSSFSSSTGKPFNSGSSGAVVGASGSPSLGDSSELSGSTSGVRHTRSNPSPISGADAASPASASSSFVSSSVSSRSSNGFGSGSVSRPSVFQASSAAKNTTRIDVRSDATTETSSSGSTIKFGSSGASKPQHTTFS